jgi:hypothetical protein
MTSLSGKETPVRFRILALALLASAASRDASADSICEAAASSFANATSVYVKSGGTAFMQEVLKDGPLADDKRALGQAQALQQIEQFFGTVQSSTVISTKALGPRTCYLVGILEYSNGPAFAVATYYKGSKGVGATSMFFKTEPETVLPSTLLIE